MRGYCVFVIDVTLSCSTSDHHHHHHRYAHTGQQQQQQRRVTYRNRIVGGRTSQVSVNKESSQCNAILPGIQMRVLGRAEDVFAETTTTHVATRKSRPLPESCVVRGRSHL